MKSDVTYEFRPFGIPLQDGKTQGVFCAKAGMFSANND